MSGGRYKIFLGMAAGVGKTYRMLQEGHAEADAGRDVVIGYLEPHEREETTAQARGLEVVPRRSVAVREVAVEELDLAALIARAPQLALIDELAHSNPPGLENRKRYEDIAAVLAAGIDVFSTVNVQHLESLNDQVAELTGVRVRETVPDSVIGEADEVVLIDLTPEALIARLQAGKIYPTSSIDAALNNFFKIENLAALREVSLRQVAEDVESKRLVYSESEPVGTRAEEKVAADAQRAVGERVFGRPASEISMARLLQQLFEITDMFGMEMQPQLVWLQKTMVVVEGVARDLDPEHNIWEASRPVVERWMKATLSPETRLREAAEGIGDFGRTLQGIFSHAAQAAASLTQGGVRLHPDSAAQIAEEEVRRTRHVRWAIWLGALALAAIALRFFL